MINNNNNNHNINQQQLRPKQHIGRSGVWGDHRIARNCTETGGIDSPCAGRRDLNYLNKKGNKSTMKIMIKVHPNDIRGNKHRRTRGKRMINKNRKRKCKKRTIYILTLHISPCPDGQRKSFEPLGEIRNLNKSFCHAIATLLRGTP